MSLKKAAIVTALAGAIGFIGYSLFKRSEREKIDKPKSQRKTGRVLVINEKNEVLLIKIEDKSVNSSKNMNPIKWITPGGKIEEGESPTVAATRELEEEVGIKNINLSSLLWFERHELMWKGVPTMIEDNFFMVRTTGQQIQAANLTEEEQRVHKEYKWWSLTELETTAENIIPEQLYHMLKSIISNSLPSQPLNIADMPSRRTARIV